MAKKNEKIQKFSLQNLKEAIDSIEQTLNTMELNAKLSKENSESLKDNYDRALAGLATSKIYRCYLNEYIRLTRIRERSLKV
jgi:hypothetical protein